jgi:hypothetical protein
MQIVDLMGIEGVQEIGDGGSGGKRACVSLSLWKGIAGLSQADSARCRDWEQKVRLVAVVQRLDYD